jgi:hypothetical protein
LLVRLGVVSSMAAANPGRPRPSSRGSQKPSTDRSQWPRSYLVSEAEKAFDRVETGDQRRDVEDVAGP